MPELAINGGTPVRSTDYPAWPVVDDEVVAAVTDVVRSGEWGGFPEPGVNGGAFEEAFAAYQGAAHGVLMMNGTVTMEVACKALDIGWGDEVIVPALTFAATAYAPMAAGAIPVFVDVTPDTWTIDPDLVEAAITRAHARDHAGAPGPPDGGHGSDHGDRRQARARGHRRLRPRTGAAVARSGAGCIGDFGSFSHQSSKILTSGEGGSLLTNDAALRSARAFDHRLRPREGSGREGVHVRRELPTVGPERRAPRRRDAALPRPAGRARRDRQGVRAGGGGRSPAYA